MESKRESGDGWRGEGLELPTFVVREDDLAPDEVLVVASEDLPPESSVRCRSVDVLQYERKSGSVSHLRSERNNNGKSATHGELHVVHVVESLWLHVPPKVKRHVRDLAGSRQSSGGKLGRAAHTSSSSHSSSSSARAGSSSTSVQAGVTNGGSVSEGTKVVGAMGGGDGQETLQETAKFGLVTMPADSSP